MCIHMLSFCIEETVDVVLAFQPARSLFKCWTTASRMSASLT